MRPRWSSRCSTMLARNAQRPMQALAYSRQLAFQRYYTSVRAANAGVVNLPQEKQAGLCSQGHVDMVTEKNSDVVHDFFTDPLRLRSDGTWLKARSCSCGSFKTQIAEPNRAGHCTFGCPSQRHSCLL